MWPFFSNAFPSIAEGINKKDRPIQDIGMKKFHKHLEILEK